MLRKESTLQTLCVVDTLSPKYKKPRIARGGHDALPILMSCKAVTSKQAQRNLGVVSRARFGNLPNVRSSNRRKTVQLKPIRKRSFTSGMGVSFQCAPPAPKTANGVCSRIFRSSHGDHVRAYCRSRRTISSKPERLRPLTCHNPVIPGFTSRTLR